MNLASSSQPFFPVSLKSIHGVSSCFASETNLFTSINFKVQPYKSLKILASSTNFDSQSSITNSEEKQDKDPNPNSKAGSKDVEAGSSKDVGVGKKEMPLALKLAMEKAKKYKQNKGNTGIVDSSTTVEEKNQGLEKTEETIPKSSGNDIVDRKVSSIDFVGLNFSDKKKSRGLPAGLVPMQNNFSDKVLSEVEMIIGDTSKFGTATPPDLNKQEESDLYKPKVSTWGVFPRPNNISKTFGGGRTIRPGDVLETEEEKAAKDARTKELLAAYKKKTGLNIDPKLKASCEKAFKNGDKLMDTGKLKEALPFYKKVMEDMAFQSELHGLAALQWSICQDSLTRQNEAKVMYEKLQYHPNATVRKKAKQFLFGFQAMEILKVKNSSLYVNTTDYRNYFEAFVQDKGSYPQRVVEEEEDVFKQILPYILFLACPILFLLAIVVKKGM
ncbi:hypothetical protein AQUCO_00900228v1 [Aquilegia coerulea]|uniref:Uncharacterized protein n=1 Tax=Aquilegia coerulea TaxID=218851 RepID=A0A2G5ECJ4_AQUCA|nr:hypothetical protein AQUCO_00900228v1 [Aquilegia coerulea]